MEEREPRKLPSEISDEEFEALDIDTTRCTTCTPCCMDHIHFLHNGKVIWACQHKLKNHKAKQKR